MNVITFFPDIALEIQLYILINMLFCTSKILKSIENRSHSNLIM